VPQSPMRGGPETLRLVRHAESVGNVVSAAARRDGREMWDTPERDPDVTLTEEGRRQAVQLGEALARLPEDDRPSVLWSSPFIRAEETARLVASTCAHWQDLEWKVDERLRDRELGVVDRLTAAGIRARYPELADLRRRFGKFYFRPPGGESWADVGLRLRSYLAELRSDYEGASVIVFAHDVVVLMFRYVLEDLDEKAILEIGRSDPVRNCSVTTYRTHGGRLRLEGYNQLAPLP
jgi:broad specificity phosphatase PhoE